jgi:subtilisin family serine protease
MTMLGQVFRRARLALGVAAGVLLAGGASTGFAGELEKVTWSIAETATLAGVPASDIDLLMGEDGRVPVFIQFVAESGADVYARELSRNAGRGEAAARQSAISAAQLQVRSNEQVHSSFLLGLEGRGVGFDVLYRAPRSVNGVAIRVLPDQIENLRNLDGVRRVELIFPEEVENASSTPFIGSPAVWSALGLPEGSTGEGVSIGIIDTGIDYQHAHFGGTGALADYQANDRTSITDTVGGQPIYPTAKVVGGRDFVGDAYNGSNATTPDSDPMDCNSHGTHVAGSAAGLGVTAAGATYTGPYSTETDFGQFRIGPGVAPGASLYALRVFGCSGGSGVVAAAIEWSMDPNGDGDFSDRLDVINMSLGSNFGERFSVTALASENATKVGVIVVASAGNASDTFFISGAPGSSSSAISVASSLDPGASAAPAVRINTPSSLAGFIPAGTAGFGSVPPQGGLSGDVVLALDGTAPEGDACQDIVNGAQVAGRIAMIDRGTCGFQIKAVRAQAAGAIGVIIANNAAGGPPGLGATPTDPAVLIPVVSVTLDAANAIKSALQTGSVNLTMFSGTDTASGFTSRGPRRGGGTLSLKPDIAAPGQNITSAQTGVQFVALPAPGAVNFVPDNQSLTISGTSMAAPHIAGVMALLKDLQPDLSVEEYKALAMNTARQAITSLPEGEGSRYGGSRVGAGRVNVHAAAASRLAAYNADEPGLVSVSFEAAVQGTVNRTKRVRIVNRSATAQSLDLSVDTIVDAPGVQFSSPASSVVVPANGSAVVEVRMAADATEMHNFRDPTVAATQIPSAATVSTNAAIGSLAPRHFLSEESANLILSQGGAERLRVPVYAAVYPVSSLQGDAVLQTAGEVAGSGAITLSGQGVCTGALAGSDCTVTGNQQRSIVTPLELSGVSPRNPFADPARDLRYVGVGFNGASDSMLFGLATWGPWSSFTDVAVRVDIDCGVYTNVGTSILTDTCTGAPDGAFDLRVILLNRGTLNQVFTAATTSAIDVYQPFVIGLAPGRTGSAVLLNGAWANALAPNLANTRLLHNEVVFFEFPRELLKIVGRFDYRVSTSFGLSPTAATNTDLAGPFPWNIAAQGINFGGARAADAQAGTQLPVDWNTTNLAANGSLGAILLHHFNGEGTRAQPVPLEGAATADVSVALSVDQPTASVGTVISVGVTARNLSSTAGSTNSVVSLTTPPGLEFIGDNAGGAFSTSTFQWTAGDLAAGQQRTVTLLFRVAERGPQVIDARLDTAAPLDPAVANNLASMVINAGSVADLGISVSADSEPVPPGGTVTYTVTLVNAGQDQAFNVNVSEVFTTPGLEPLVPSAFSASQGSYDPITGFWSIASLSLNAGQPATLTLTFPVGEAQAAGPMTLRVSATSTTQDANSLNNTAEATVTVESVNLFSDGFED